MSQGFPIVKQLFSRRITRHLLSILGLGVLAAALAGWGWGGQFLEKLATQLVLPCGLIGLALAGLAYAALICQPRRWAAPTLVLLLFYWTAGSPYTSEWFMLWLERPFEPVDIGAQTPYDTLIVLGGGTMTNPQGDAWLGNVGDRLALAARLYHQGKAGQLVATGQGFDWSTNRAADPAEASARIWRELGIPDQAIVRVGGRNTTEEMQQIRRFLDQHPGGRVGLITSAFHLPRALRLARAHGIEVLPVPADFRSGVLPPWPRALIPSSEGFLKSEFCAKEFLAYLIGR